MTVTVVPYRAEHALHIQNRDMDRPETDVEYWVQREANSMAWTILLDGEPVGCAGLGVQHDGVGWVWCHFGREIERLPVSVHRYVRRMLRDVIGALDLHRVEAAIDPTNERNVRWARRLGFEPEGVARKYTPDKRDALRCAIVR